MEYARLVETYEILQKTASRLKKIEAIATLLEESPAEILPTVTLLVQGMLFPSWSDKEVGIANQLMIKAISQTAGFPESEIVKRFNKTGDLGLVIEELTAKKKQRTLSSRKLTVEKVFENLQSIASITGNGTVDRKLALVCELLACASPKEAKYIARTTLGTLRIGVAEGVVRDAIAKAFFADIIWGEHNERIVQAVEERGKKFVVEKGFLEKMEHPPEQAKEKTIEEIEHLDLWKKKGRVDYVLFSDEKRGAALKDELLNAVEMAWFVRPHYGEIAKIASEEGLEGLRRVELEVGRPYHILLAEKSPSLTEALGSYEHFALEWKYDGARISIHKKGSQIWLFTRRLENVTKQFPEVARWARSSILAHEAIIEGEMIGILKGKPMPFQFLSQRIKRKYDIEKTAQEIPVQVNLFDMVYENGKSLFRLPLRERWTRLLKGIKPISGVFQFVKHIETMDTKKAEDFYTEALAAGQEGLMVKNLDAFYQPGRRVGYWLKVKPTMENLDLVIIGATWGTGKRVGWLGSLVLGCRDKERGNFLECGMIGTGIKEKGEGITFPELTKILKSFIESEKGNQVTIKPKIVVEVAYEEIQKSPTYSSGYALRFPRVVRIRDDKSPAQADDLERLQTLFSLQSKRGSVTSA